ncbi:1-hydroxycarotenoid 3,4-desaturase CrtD [Planktotalea sp.]|uniref:1-hydroxycarotenoid 3,4-desaturase CrtD n=1 Tax=Planktotalea sp. TaxID=2029877 RepID=UPI003F6D74BD
MTTAAPHIAIIGAGIGGLAAALRLSYAGCRVTVLERHAGPGGKMRTLPTIAGDVDAGPTVLTMKSVFEDLFADAGLRLEDHVTLQAEDILARHFWRDGKVLDLMRDAAHSGENVARAFGSSGAEEFTAFCQQTDHLFDAFDGPMIRSAQPSLAELALTVAKSPKLLRAMRPLSTLTQNLNRHFTDPRLAQLFARYATYVGGLPTQSPSLLSLIWQAENQGVWYVKGGMHQLAKSIVNAARGFGTEFVYNAHVTRIKTQDGSVCAVQTEDTRYAVDAVLFNGDPNALQTGLLGPTIEQAVNKGMTTPRSLSANVMSFAAIPKGVDLAAHNVFFARDPQSEYAPLARGQQQRDPTLYICAQDRFGGATPDGPERFEIILNSPPNDKNAAPSKKETEQCQTLILQQLDQFGLDFSPQPAPDTLTMTRHFAQLFPASHGSLYGRSPHGMMAAFKRPSARSKVKGLYLAGGGTHPGAGVPMATLSGAHAAAAILSDLTST